MKDTRVETFAKHIEPSTTTSVRTATKKITNARVVTLSSIYKDFEDARTFGAETKAYVLDHLKELLLQFEAECTKNGITVHWASDHEEANEIIIDLCRGVAPQGGVIAKAKSMATEEIHLNRHLEDAGFTPVETDLGEFVVQLDGDTPSHIVAPIIHKTRLDVAKTFHKEGIGPYTEVPEELALQARGKLRQTFREAQIGISGVNFGIASTGTLVIVENEGNNRYSTTAPKVHIALMGIEKLLPSLDELPVFLQLLAGSATGQKLTTYVHMIKGPRQPDELDGPDEVHLVLLDNNRTKVLNGQYRSILRCIRCGACLNVCPVYRQASGHAYGHVYSGPVGAVLAPAMEGISAIGDLAKASSLCGACEEVCPMKIPIPTMLLDLRDEAFREDRDSRSINWKGFEFAADHPTVWRTGLKLLPMAKLAPHPLKQSWESHRDLPKPSDNNFRKWWNGRS